VFSSARGSAGGYRHERPADNLREGLSGLRVFMTSDDGRYEWQPRKQPKRPRP